MANPNKNYRVTVRLPASVEPALEQLAIRQGMTKAEYVRKVILNDLNGLTRQDTLEFLRAELRGRFYGIEEALMGLIQEQVGYDKGRDLSKPIAVQRGKSAKRLRDIEPLEETSK